jgi:hypothetical protein
MLYECNEERKDCPLAAGFAGEELNRRLENGEAGAGLVEWLNGLPAVQQVLQAQFGGRPIREQNLSEWRDGGYRDWQEQEEKRGLLRQVTEEAGELSEDAGGDACRSLAAVLTAELAVLARDGLREMPDPKEWREWLLEALAALGRVRREEHLAGQMVIQQERWEKEKAHAKRWGAIFKECLAPWVPRPEAAESEGQAGSAPEISDQVRPNPTKEKKAEVRLPLDDTCKRQNFSRPFGT